MKDLVFCWCCGVGCSGYVAVIVWRSVQVDRPSSSTSGGQSDGRVEGVVSAVAAAGMEDVVGEVVLALLDVFIMESQSEVEVQVRQLVYCQKWCSATLESMRTYGLPFLSSTTPFGSLVGAGLVVSSFW